jgi:hypothetical protein
MESAATRTTGRMANPLLWGIAWLLFYFGARLLLESDALQTWQRVAIAVAPIPVAAIALGLIVRGARELDELELRIQLEALATAFLLTILFLMTLGLMQRAVTLKFEDWSYAHVWAMLPTLYFLGLIVARRRYA